MIVSHTIFARFNLWRVLIQMLGETSLLLEYLAANITLKAIIMRFSVMCEYVLIGIITTTLWAFYSILHRSVFNARLSCLVALEFLVFILTQYIHALVGVLHYLNRLTRGDRHLGLLIKIC